MHGSAFKRQRKRERDWEMDETTDAVIRKEQGRSKKEQKNTKTEMLEMLSRKQSLAPLWSLSLAWPL